MTTVGSLREPGPDRAGFVAFYRATAERTFAIARRAAGGDREIAHDATQQAYVVMLERWHQRCGRSLTDNSHYVVGIAVRKVADSYRQRTRLVWVAYTEDSGAEDFGFAEVLDELTILPAVRQLIASQPDRRRAVGVLFFLEDFTFREIADILNITESTVRTHIERLRVLLKPLIDADGQFGQGGERP